MYAASRLLKLVLVLVVFALGHQTDATPAPPLGNSTFAPLAALPADRARLNNSTISSTPDHCRRSNLTESVRPWPGWTWVDGGCLYNDETQQCLDAEQSRKNWQSTDAQMWKCNKNWEAQEIVFHGHPEHNVQYVKALVKAPGYLNRYCLDVPGGNAYEGQIVRWWSCNDSEAQHWLFSRQGGTFPGRLSPRSRPDLCLDPAGGIHGNRDGQPMRLWRCWDHPIHSFSVGPWDSLVCAGMPGGREARRQD